MVTVDLVTSWGVRCGIAEYAHDLVTASDKAEVQWHMQDVQDKGAHGSQIVHLNHEDGLLRCWDQSDVMRLKAAGKKVVMTKHNSGMYCRTPLSTACDVVIVHEENKDGFVHIPHGIFDWENPGIEPQMRIGTAGFPQGHKAFCETAQIAKDLGVGLLVVTAASPHGDAQATADAIHRVHSDAEVVTEWMSKDKVAELMASCAVNVFLRWSNMSGISGAVRLGLMSGRPVVISRDRQFHDLYDNYLDEIYLVDQSIPTMEAARGVVALALSDQSKKPTRILRDMSWKKCAKQYVDIYKGLVV